MATPTQTLRRPRSPKRVQRQTRIRGPEPETTTRTRREETLVDTKAREVRARRDLALALVRAEQRYALAARRLEEFDDYLRGLRARLRDAGYLPPQSSRPGETAGRCWRLARGGGAKRARAAPARRGGNWTVTFRRKNLGQVSSALFARSSEAAAASLSSTRTCAPPESTNGKAPPASSALIAASIPAEASRP
jgi:hypothetical protein